MTVDPLNLNRLIRTIAADELRPLADDFGDGIAAVVEGSYASVRKGDPNAAPTAGFYVPPGLVVLVGDHVLYWDNGGFKLVLVNLSRNGFIPAELMLTDLVLAGRIRRSGIISPPALTASVNDYAPDGWATCSIVRIDQSGGAWNLTGMLAGVDGEERELHNISAGSVTLTDSDAASAAENRVLGPGGVDYVLTTNAGVVARYDSLSARWRLVG